MVLILNEDKVHIVFLKSYKMRRKKLFLNFLSSNFCDINTGFLIEAHKYGEKRVKFDSNEKGAIWIAL